MVDALRCEREASEAGKRGKREAFGSSSSTAADAVDEGLSSIVIEIDSVFQ